MARVDVCLWRVGDKDCGENAVARVVLRDGTTSTTASIPVCQRHKSEHNRKAAKLRAQSK